jgi:hypothetical protein
MAIFTAGAAFYRYIWPGVSQAQQPESVRPSQPPSISVEPSGQIVAEPSKQKDLSVLISISKVADKDLIGMKVVSPQGVDLGFIAQVNRDAQGTVVSIGVTNSPPPNANSPITQIKVPHTP